MMTKGILVVSFGTSYKETREKTIDVIENEIQAAYPDHKVYRAWTSRMILAKLKKRDGIHYDNVIEAMDRMLSDGIRQVTVQPTHVINGIENDKMKEEVLAYKDRFEKIAFGTPMLTSQDDIDRAAQNIVDEFAPQMEENSTLVLMGHGTPHYANAVYAALNYRFRDIEYPKILMATVEAYPDVDAMLRFVKKEKPDKVYLTPFMIVAGDHANNDMAGEDEDSWASILKREGIEVEPVLKGLGEYRSFRKILIDHVGEAV